MSRNRRYRAWDFDSQKMHYFSGQEMIGVQEGEWFISFEGDVWERHEGTGGDFIVPNIELMEFTGLSDKDDNEVWEGDVMFNDDRKEYADVQWDDDRAMFICQYPLSEDRFPLSESIGNLYSVVGNIYENSELIHTQNEQ